MYFVNDYKFDKNKIMFMHIPKTGGQSLDQIIIKYDVEKLIESYYLNWHLPISKFCLPEDGFKYITFLRNPIDRILSHYNMYKRMSWSENSNSKSIPKASIENLYI